MNSFPGVRLEAVGVLRTFSGYVIFLRLEICVVDAVCFLVLRRNRFFVDSCIVCVCFVIKILLN